MLNFLRKRKTKKKEPIKVDEISTVESKKKIQFDKIDIEKIDIEEALSDFTEVKKEKATITFDDVQKSTKKVGVKTIVVEHEKHKDEMIKTPPMPKKKEALSIPVKIREQVEKYILKILYKEKSVKSLKVLTDKVLEYAVNDKITVSEKVISLIISQMDKDAKIQFTQKEGWKIKI